jgi:predicted O-linked N-acetylglucosamine transferase (SPINDLY family)
MSTATLPARFVAPAPTVNPQAEQHWRTGVQSGKAGRWKDAERSFARAVRIMPAEPLYAVNLGQARRRLGDLEGALTAVDQALSADPSNPLAISLRLTIKLERNRSAEALEDALRMTELKPDDHQTWVDLADVHYRIGRPVDAANALLQGLIRRPDHLPAYVQLGNVFQLLTRHAEAVECFRTALALKPDWESGLTGVIYHSLYTCDWSRLDEDLAALDERLARGGALDLSPFMFLSAGKDGRVQREVVEQFVRKHFGSIETMPPVDPASRPACERLRIGYLSNDFHQHATAMLITHVLELHDAERFEVRLYSYGKDDGSTMRKRLERCGDAFIDIAGMSDQEAAELIRRDRIDVLVELKGFTLAARMGITARRPAPIQVGYLGFPGTLGASFIDYQITDEVVSPPEMADHFTEKLAYMPHCYQPNDRLREVNDMPSRASCGLPEEGFVFCCFNHTYKIRPELFDIWCRLLHAVPGSVLWLLESNSQARENIEHEAIARGIDPSRLVFAPIVQPRANLARLANADLFLDTLPVNAHTTASDALWAGVPLVTCPGDSFVARVAASLLTAVGLEQLVCDDLTVYESRALEIATDASRLAELKRHLREARDIAPLFDSAATARGLEDLYERMVAGWRSGRAPELIAPMRELSIQSEAGAA